MKRSPALYRVVILARGKRPLYAEPSGPRLEDGTPGCCNFPEHRTPAGLLSRKDAQAIAKRLRPWPGRKVKVEETEEAKAAFRQVTGEAA